MSSMSPIVLILGVGGNIGQSVSCAFADKGYRVALTARGLDESASTPDKLHIRSDLADPTSVVDTFQKVRSRLGQYPEVVVYNAGAATTPSAKDPLGALSLEGLTRDMNVNTMSPFVAAQQALKGFRELPTSASRTFIFTGNCLNVSPIVALMGAGMGKTATAHMIQCAAEAYAKDGFKFYYADERKADGSPAYGAIDGPAHGKLYTELAQGAVQGPWMQTFVKGSGYKNFL